MLTACCIMSVPTTTLSGGSIQLLFVLSKIKPPIITMHLRIIQTKSNNLTKEVILSDTADGATPLPSQTCSLYLQTPSSKRLAMALSELHKEIRRSGLLDLHVGLGLPRAQRALRIGNGSWVV